MIVKIVTIFLVAMIVLAMFGRLRWPGHAHRSARKPARPPKCRACGAPRIGTGPCPCGEK
ncbi:hypothetical protein [Tropicimonas sp. IMCC34011]|uniref:hypothetical protein n=1 Tax=Tropicimonas sp. IMCC34011 TaxID=2248759 RepID=UPI000E27F5AB|nr:hypothetical protein [Tropicimonas sp. IMCC34011]